MRSPHGNLLTSIVEWDSQKLTAFSNIVVEEFELSPKSIFLSLMLVLLSATPAIAMPRPKPGESLGSWELGIKTPVASEKDSWKSAIRGGLNAGPFWLSVEDGNFGPSGATQYFGFSLGLGSGPLMRQPSTLGLQWFGRINYFSMRWREEQSTFYSGLEFGASKRLNSHLGAFASVSFEYPGLLMVPTAIFPSVRDDIRARDGVALFLNFGLAVGKVASPEQTGVSAEPVPNLVPANAQ